MQFFCEATVNFPPVRVIEYILNLEKGANMVYKDGKLVFKETLKMDYSID